jgi:dynactin 1
VIKHLAELHLRDSLDSYAEEALMNILLIQSSLENTASALVAAKAEILRIAPPTDDDNDEAILFEQKADGFVLETRSARVIAGKIQHALHDMKSRNLALNVDTNSQFEKVVAISDQLSSFARGLGNAVATLVNQQDGVPLEFSDILSTIRAAASSFFDIPNTDVFTPAQTKLRALRENLEELQSLATDLSQMTEFEIPQPPWLLRSKEMLERKALSASAEEEIAVLKRDIQNRATNLKMKSEELEEAKMKNDLLSSRMKDANKKLEGIANFEDRLKQATERERSMERAVEKQTALLQKLEDDRDKWMRKAAEAKASSKVGEDATKDGADFVGTSAEMDSLRSRIEVLQATTRYLRQQVNRKRLEELEKENGWLAAPLLKPRPANAEVTKLRKVMTNVAGLPSTAKPMALPELGEKRSKPQALTSTPKYQLIEQETAWLKTWKPIGADWRPSNVRIAGVGPV